MIRSPMPSRSKSIKPSTKRMKAGCDCATCHPNTFGDLRFIVCSICGNKRCPHANDHRNECTGSNEVGQPGSSWASVKPFNPRKRMKSSSPKMTPARKAARGKPCMVRIPGVCNGNPETTVLAHYRLQGYCGTGMKPPDEMAAWACSACHDEIDRRTRKLADPIIARLAHAEGVMRTQQAVRDEE